MYISREYFAMLDSAVSKLTAFHMKLRADEQFFSQAKEKYPWSIFINDSEGLKTILLIDVVNCYKEIGYALDLDTMEGLGLFMLSFDQGNPQDGVHDYSRFQFVYSMGKGAVQELINAIGEQSAWSADGMVMASLLEDQDEVLVRQYHVLLYRFMSVIAKADGTVNEKESEYLATMLARTEEKRERKTGGYKNPEGAGSAKKYFERSKPQANFDGLENLPAMQELDEMIGLAGVKQEIHGLANFARVMQLRKQEGLKTAPLSLHCVFTGNPGTGKTTVARILGKIYHYLGLLDTDKFVETDRSGLVAEYVGQTAVKTNKVVDSALDGVLFIDEAYSLVSSDKSDFGMEAISTLLKRMEDDRDRLVVILAGYTDNMETFIQANPGLRSRFSRTIEFEDYDEDELFRIFELNLKKYEYTLDPEAAEVLRNVIRDAVAGRDKDFGNARYVRNIFEKAIQNQANRVAYLPHVSAENLTVILAEDVRNLPLR